MQNCTLHIFLLNSLLCGETHFWASITKKFAYLCVPIEGADGVGALSAESREEAYLENVDDEATPGKKSVTRKSFLKCKTLCVALIFFFSGPSWNHICLNVELLLFDLIHGIHGWLLEEECEVTCWGRNKYFGGGISIKHNLRFFFCLFLSSSLFSLFIFFFNLFCFLYLFLFMAFFLFIHSFLVPSKKFLSFTKSIRPEKFPAEFSTSSRARENKNRLFRNAPAKSLSGIIAYRRIYLRAFRILSIAFIEYWIKLPFSGWLATELETNVSIRTADIIVIIM